MTCTTAFSLRTAEACVSGPLSRVHPHSAMPARFVHCHSSSCVKAAAKVRVCLPVSALSSSPAGSTEDGSGTAGSHSRTLHLTQVTWLQSLTPQLKHSYDKQNQTKQKPTTKHHITHKGASALYSEAMDFPRVSPQAPFCKAEGGNSYTPSQARA